jgi:DNA-binding CsgD family transcriptional regulator
VEAVPIVGERESATIRQFRDRALLNPAGLVIEGDAGMGKTTLLAHVVADAHTHRFRVLQARGAHAELSFAYAAVADLLSGVGDEMLTDLPVVQRMALDRVLNGGADGPGGDERVVAAALQNVITRLATESPVLVAVDDAHWLDSSSRVVIGFVSRRLSARVGIALAVRTGDAAVDGALAWMKLPAPESLSRIRVSPLSLGGVYALIASRLGRTLTRPTIARIYDVSGGNPLFALELARSFIDDPSQAFGLPEGLATLVRDRLGDLDDEVSDVLLAAACAAAPTVELLCAATAKSLETVTASLEPVEDRGVVRIDGNRVQFAHPLLATGVYTAATAARRRAMHRTLATLTEQPELRARHLALAATTADAATLEALDAASEVTGTQGAPAAGAELTELAIKLGGDTVERRIRAAEQHFRSGNPIRAEAMLDHHTMDRLSGPLRAMALAIRAGMRIYASNFHDAVGLLEQARDDAAGIPFMLVPLLQYLSYSQLNAGKCQEALVAAEECLRLAEAIGVPALVSQALATRANARFFNGLGLDEAGLQRALQLQEPDAESVIPLGADAIGTMIFAWAGRLDEAIALMQDVRRRCIERGADAEMLWVEIHGTTVSMWRGELDAANRAAEEAVQRAQQIGGDSVLVMALTSRCWVAAVAGRVHDSRMAGTQATEAARRCGDPEGLLRPIEPLAFLEVSLGNWTDALDVLQPRLQAFADMPNTEFHTAAFIPDAVEALTAVGRTNDAEPLIEALETNGLRLDRPWMLAIGARCRALAHSARGDLDAAEHSALEAMTHHERLPMPIDTARTQLLLGQIQRRRGHRQAAAATLSAALEAFDRIGVPLWSERARDELTRLRPSADGGLGLTTAERRVATLAAVGSSNKQIGSALFITEKTVESHLTSIYRKLGVRSRAALASRLSSDGIEGNP